MHWFYYVGRIIMRLLLFLFTRWEVKGREYIPPQGPLLVAANHLHNADPPLLGVCINRTMIFMAKEGLFRNPLSRFFVTNFGAFPVSRSRLTRTAITRADEVLQKGLALAMFPEGGRSRRGHLVKALPGSALIALKNDVPILPVGIAGTEMIKGRFWWLRRPRITVTIGSAFHLPQGDGKVTKETLEQATDYIMERIAELLPPSYRGKYAGKKAKEH